MTSVLISSACRQGDQGKVEDLEITPTAPSFRTKISTFFNYDYPDNALCIEINYNAVKG